MARKKRIRDQYKTPQNDPVRSELAGMIAVRDARRPTVKLRPVGDITSFAFGDPVSGRPGADATLTERIAWNRQVAAEGARETGVVAMLPKGYRERVVTA
jgi:hypothetical protein